MKRAPRSFACRRLAAAISCAEASSTVTLRSGLRPGRERARPGRRRRPGSARRAAAGAGRARPGWPAHGGRRSRGRRPSRRTRSRRAPSSSRAAHRWSHARACDAVVGASPRRVHLTATEAVAQATQKRDRVRAQRIDRVAALLERNDRVPELRDPRADARVVVGLQREVADRVGVEGVEAERQHERRIGIEGGNGVEAVGQRGEVAVAIGSGGKRKVQVRADAAVTASLGGVPGVVRVDAARIAVEAHVQHVVTVPEDLLRAVAVMEVDVQDRHPRGAAGRPATRPRSPRC